MVPEVTGYAKGIRQHLAMTQRGEGSDLTTFDLMSQRGSYKDSGGLEFWESIPMKEKLRNAEL